MRDRLLTVHFLQRFLENDLVSPDADRHGTAAMVLGALLSAGMFIGAGMSLKYLQMPLQSPGRTAVMAVGDRFVLTSISMVVTALAAVAAWDALSLDPRDTAILGPLPIARRVIVRAKLRAVAIFAATFALAIGTLSGIAQPMLMVARLPVGLLAALWLVAVQLAVTLSAGLFAFASVVAIREGLRALLGPRFTRVSAALQASMIVLLVAGFLLLPAIVSSVSRDGRLARLLPPAWFVGVHETVAGGLVAGLPRPPLPRSLDRLEDGAAVRYREIAAIVRPLAWNAAAGLAVTLVLAVGGSLWNSRRLPLPLVCGPAVGSRPGLAFARAIACLFVRRPAARAGFFLALQCLVRSAPHRVVMAGCTAVSLALAIALIAIGSSRIDAASVVPPHALVMAQTVALVVLLAGFRHAMRLPADVSANRLFRLAWQSQHRSFVAGVRVAALAAIVLPVVLSLLPVHVVALGWRVAGMHLLTGVLLGAALAATLVSQSGQLPLAAGYAPAETNTMGPAVVMGAVIVASMFAQIERHALTAIQGAAVLWAVLLAVPIVEGVTRGHGPDVDLLNVFDAPPPGATRLDLG